MIEETRKPPSLQKTVSNMVESVHNWFNPKIAFVAESADKLTDKIALAISEKNGCSLQKDEVKELLIGTAKLFGKLLLVAAVITVLVKAAAIFLIVSALSSVSMGIYSTYQAAKAGKIAYTEGESIKETMLKSITAFFDKGIRVQYLAGIERAKEFTLNAVEEMDQTRQLFIIFGQIISKSFIPEPREN